MPKYRLNCTPKKRRERMAALYTLDFADYSMFDSLTAIGDALMVEAGNSGDIGKITAQALAVLLSRMAVAGFMEVKVSQYNMPLATEVNVRKPKEGEEDAFIVYGLQREKILLSDIKSVTAKQGSVFEFTVRAEGQVTPGLVGLYWDTQTVLISPKTKEAT